MKAMILGVFPCVDGSNVQGVLKAFGDKHSRISLEPCVVAAHDAIGILVVLIGGGVEQILHGSPGKQIPGRLRIEHQITRITLLERMTRVQWMGWIQAVQIIAQMFGNDVGMIVDEKRKIRVDSVEHRLNRVHQSWYSFLRTDVFGKFPDLWIGVSIGWIRRVLGAGAGWFGRTKHRVMLHTVAKFTLIMNHKNSPCQRPPSLLNRMQPSPPSLRVHATGKNHGHKSWIFRIEMMSVPMLVLRGWHAT
mmetsp:Transcript_34712/g.50962  ORF Transcript_34712/g.50962 Transcript_34712/m.50962 type:complete len:248 (+) Transcript_34712:770-1513(+)